MTRDDPGERMGCPLPDTRADDTTREALID